MMPTTLKAAMKGGGFEPFSLLLRVIAAAILLLILAPAQSHAASRLCRDLEAKLAALPRAGGNNQATKYDRAISMQQTQLDRARQQSRKAGCGFAIFPGSVVQCGQLASTIEKMEANMAGLQRTRQRLGGGGDTRRERASLMASLEVNGCRKRPPAVQPVAAEAGSSIQRIEPPGVRLAAGGRYRTMCVRTCDGYYFPIGNASSPQQFQQDQQKCESLCPGTEARLYYHSPASQEAAEMMSVASGEAYAQQPFAFRYRDVDHARPESCSCNAQPRNFSIIAGNPPVPEQAAPVEKTTPRPLPRPDPALDPETLANREGGLDAAAIERLLRDPDEPTSRALSGNETERRVRVVGPTFLPDPEGAIDLRAPVQQHVR